jgi:hypothetical protein
MCVYVCVCVCTGVYITKGMRKYIHTYVHTYICILHIHGTQSKQDKPDGSDEQIHTYTVHA